MPPLVTVLMPARNAAPYVQAAIESLQVQDYPNLEIIAVDDGSTDDTGPMLEFWLGRSGRPFTVLQNAVSRGPGASCNQAVGVASGTYLIRADADDVSSPGRVSTQVTVMEHSPSLDAMAGAIRFVDERGRRTRVPLSLRHRPFSPTGNHWALLVGNTVRNPAVMLRRTAFESLGGYSEATPLEDYEYFLRLRRHRLGNIATGGERLVRYRVHAGNLSKRSPLESHLTVTPALAIMVEDELGIRTDAADLAAMQVPSFVTHGEQARRCIALLSKMEAAVLARTSPPDARRIRGWIAGKRLQHTRKACLGRGRWQTELRDLGLYGSEAARWEGSQVLASIVNEHD